MEVPTITKEQIEAAKQDTSHQIVQVMLSMPDYFQKLREGYKPITDNNQEAQRFVKEQFSPLVNALNQLDDFSVSPLDIISIWSRAEQDLEGIGYARYELAGTIGVVYGTRGSQSESFRNRIVEIINKNAIPKDLAKDEQAALYFFRRLKALSGSIDEITFYIHGTREDMGDLATKAFGDKDEKAKKRWDELQKWSKEHQDDFLGSVCENWGNGLLSYSFSMPNDIRAKLKRK